MAEDADGTLTVAPASDEAPTIADRSLRDRRMDIARTRGRLSLALGELEGRARRQFLSIGASPPNAPATSGLVNLVVAASGLVARLRDVAPLVVGRRGIAIGAVGVAAALLAARFGDSAAGAGQEPCPRCGEPLHELQGFDDTDARVFRCLRCGWLGDAMDYAAEQCL